MESFSKYFYKNKKVYKYTIKLAIPEITDSMIDQLESGLGKYNLLSASKFESTPIQMNPLDFPNIHNMPVYASNIEIEYPASLDFLRVFVGNLLAISPQAIAIYSENDPREMETDLYIFRNSSEFKDNYVPALGSEYIETGDKDLYGQTYNSEFLNDLAKERESDKLEVYTNALSHEFKPDHADLGKDYDEFNSEKNNPVNQPGLFGRIKRADVRGV